MKIKLTKTGIPQNAAYPSETDKNKVAQDLGDKSPWIDYEVVGDIQEIPEVGELLFISRTERNGVEIYGHFRTSKIKTICENVNKFGETEWYDVITQNSIYRLEILD
jgi:hypothetical protein